MVQAAGPRVKVRVADGTKAVGDVEAEPRTFAVHPTPVRREGVVSGEAAAAVGTNVGRLRSRWVGGGWGRIRRDRREVPSKEAPEKLTPRARVVRPEGLPGRKVPPRIGEAAQLLRHGVAELAKVLQDLGVEVVTGRRVHELQERGRGMADEARNVAKTRHEKAPSHRW